MNVDINDIKGIEQELGIQLTNEQRKAVLNRFQQVVLDRAGDWTDIIKELINEIC